jgi:hypothetical protein
MKRKATLTQPTTERFASDRWVRLRPCAAHRRGARGVAFESRDGSFNLRFDYLPARMEQTTIQLCEFDAKEE